MGAAARERACETQDGRGTAKRNLNGEHWVQPPFNPPPPPPGEDCSVLQTHQTSSRVAGSSNQGSRSTLFVRHVAHLVARQAGQSGMDNLMPE